MERPFGSQSSVTPGGRVLIIDDELALLRSYKRTLRRLFDVVLVSDPREAIELIEKDRAFDVIVCDVRMPHMNGAAVYAAVAKIAPELLERIIFCSGGPGSNNDTVIEWLTTIDNVQLLKPVSIEALRATIASVRDAHTLIG
ncbi:MAG: response regulator [Deltaproteobacteria bacterium]